MKKLRFGVIGASGIADRRTIPGLLQAENAELVAVMSRDPEVAERLRQKWGAKYAYSSVEDLARCPEIDAVYIGTPLCAMFSRQKAALTTASTSSSKSPWL